MKAIGITGGIGSGKSTVSRYLKEKGYYVIDADLISRNLTSKNGEALPKIKEYFGEEVFNLDGTLNRKKLADIVFNDKDKLNILQSFTTDIVNKKMREEICSLREEKKMDLVFLDIPLLFETGDEAFLDETWLITCDMDIRIDRVSKRDNASKEEIRDRILNQMPDSVKEKLATRIIDNSLDEATLFSKIDNLLKIVCN